MPRQCVVLFLLKTTLWTCGREFQEDSKFAFQIGFGFLPVSSPSPIVEVYAALVVIFFLLRPSELTLTGKEACSLSSAVLLQANCCDLSSGVQCWRRVKSPTVGCLLEEQH